MNHSGNLSFGHYHGWNYFPTGSYSACSGRLSAVHQVSWNLVPGMRRNFLGSTRPTVAAQGGFAGGDMDARLARVNYRLGADFATYPIRGSPVTSRDLAIAGACGVPA